MYLLDTNTIIDFYKATLPIAGRKILEENLPQISVITRIELFSSKMITVDEMMQLEAFITIAKVYDCITKAIIDNTIKIRQQHKTKLPDAIIAATALTYNLTLITRNTTDLYAASNL